MLTQIEAQTFPLSLSLPWQWEVWKFSAPVLHVLESCAFGPGLVGSRGAQCVLLSQAPAVLRHPCMALESFQALRGCPCKWGSVHVTTELLQTSLYFILPPPISVDRIGLEMTFLDYIRKLGKMLLWIIRLIAINSVKWCANDWGSCFSTFCFCKG